MQSHGADKMAAHNSQMFLLSHHLTMKQPLDLLVCVVLFRESTAQGYSWVIFGLDSMF